jgi:hypothetical protein
MKMPAPIYRPETTFETWADRREAAREYLKRRPWSLRAAFFQSVIRAADALEPEPPVRARPVPAPFGGGSPTAASVAA